MMKGTGGVPLNVLHPIRGDKNKREAMIRLVERHNPDNAKELRKWVIEKRRRYLQQTQESAKQQLVLVPTRRCRISQDGRQRQWSRRLLGRRHIGAVPASACKSKNRTTRWHQPD